MHCSALQWGKAVRLENIQQFWQNKALSSSVQAPDPAPALCPHSRPCPAQDWDTDNVPDQTGDCGLDDGGHDAPQQEALAWQGGGWAGAAGGVNDTKDWYGVIVFDI